MLETNTTSSINNRETSSNKDICSGFGCIDQATRKVDIPAGTFGLISLNICDNCVKKFIQKDKGD